MFNFVLCCESFFDKVICGHNHEHFILFKAIKIGRYTHQKRLHDTLEVKQGYVAPTNASSPSGDGTSQYSQNCGEGSSISSPEKPVASLSSCPKSASVATGSSSSAGGEQNTDGGCAEQAELLEHLAAAFRVCFVDTTCMFEQQEFVDNLVHDMMKANNMQCLDHIITYSGHSATDEEMKCIKKITEQVKIF